MSSTRFVWPRQPRMVVVFIYKDVMKNQSSENSIVSQRARDLYQQTMRFGIGRKDALETMSTGPAVAMTTVMNPQRDKFLSDHSSLLAHLDSDQADVIEGVFTELISTGHRMYWTEKVIVENNTYTNFVKLSGPRFVEYLEGEYKRYFSEDGLLESEFLPCILSASDVFGVKMIDAVSSQHEDIIHSLVGGGDPKQFARFIADLKQTAASLVFSGYVLSYLQDKFIESLGVENDGSEAATMLDTDDDLYEDVKEHIVALKTVSTANLQRRFRIGYARASRLLDQLEEDGIIGQREADSGARRVL